MQGRINRTSIKYLAALAMLIDHLAMVFVQPASALYFILRAIGRLSAPIFCMFVAEGFVHTSNKLKYVLRLTVFAIVSQFPYSYLNHNKVFVFNDYNVIFTLLIAFLCLCCYCSIKNVVLRCLCVIALTAVSVFCDWGIFAPIWVLSFYLLRSNNKMKAIFHCIVSLLVTALAIAFCVINEKAWYSNIWQLGLYLFVPIIFLYDGQKCKTNAFNKWFFYLFYPLHMVILIILKVFI